MAALVTLQFGASSQREGREIGFKTMSWFCFQKAHKKRTDEDKCLVIPEMPADTTHVILILII